MTQRDEALRAAMAEADPSSLGAGERLRRRFGPDDAAWALGQTVLRRAAASKFSRPDEMLFTRDGLEQASRESVARWRAARFVEAGVEEVWDLGCGIGSDAMAFSEAGLRVVAVDADAETAAVAAHNLALVGRGDVRVGLAEESEPPPGAAIFLDPARRTAKGRTWNVADFTPPWEFVLDQLASDRFVAVKLGPGVPKELIPQGVLAGWVSEHGDVVEATLWNRLGPGTEAVVLPHVLHPGATAPLDVRPLGQYLIEPDGAVIRSGLIADVAPEADVWLLDPHTAYLSSDEPVDSPFATTFKVLDVLGFDVRALRRYVAEHGIGTLEIKKRAIDVDPALLRRQLKPRGRGSATIILARTLMGTRAVIAARI
ncbi:hypothetical protein SAMN02745244_01452 [Tessaracoccus bendigoensis DSM 12906]|uniref:THUMP-like domain-containing protein n=1 Tax=Tessaracoccus bendigoensis DSM 12906 TaxID=1123357 RepID=A0A1M6FH86_9ACTN|nr:class I SAM-dependent methyltransferase [Tessaracoccus bendigoensis]SHI97098.1 hypothetical protein SAMN02745244_01452 [Tessaracoccus bendigoensis DSM 12906]